MSVNSNLEHILSQTTYSEEEALNRLETHNNNVEHVIREFTGLPIIDENKTNLTANQEMFRQFRLLCHNDAKIKYMDDVRENHQQFTLHK